MKVKIKELFSTIIPKYQYFGNKSVFTLKIIDKFKYNILPVKILSPYSGPSSFLLFYDGSIAGRQATTEYNAFDAAFMPSLFSSDPYWEDPEKIAGWTAGSTLGYITSREMQYSVQALVKQGLTASSKARVWMNFETPWENYILFDGYTGPSTAEDAEKRTIVSDFYQKLFFGGTGTDGITFLGLKQYFPGISFGVYGQPRWTYYLLGSSIWNLENSTIDNAINFAAEQWLGCTGIVNGVDMIMPSVYSRLNIPRANRIFTGQNIKLCNKINEKLEQQDRSKKEIIAFVSPFFWTYSTGNPYFHQSWTNKKQYRYTPPYTFFNNEDTTYDCGEQIIEQGADGAIVWASINYAAYQIKSGNAEYDIIVSDPQTWREGPTAGVSNPWSYRAIMRQSVSAQENYTKGVSMGITGSHWWWQAGPQTEIHTPAEWLPLSTNPAPGATTGITGAQMVDRLLKNAVYDQLSVLYNLAKNKNWISTSESILKSNSIVPDMPEDWNPTGSTYSINTSFYKPLD
jgi:hypothetical protein